LLRSSQRGFLTAFLNLIVPQHVIDLVRYEKCIKKGGQENDVELKTKEVKCRDRRCFIAFLYPRDTGEATVSNSFSKKAEKLRANIADSVYPPAITARLVQGEDIHDQIMASICFCTSLDLPNATCCATTKYANHILSFA
jgi:hypothetical protein